MFTFNRSAVWEMYKMTASELQKMAEEMDNAIVAENAAFDAHFNCDEGEIEGTWEAYKERVEARQAIEARQEAVNNIRQALRVLMNEADNLDDITII